MPPEKIGGPGEAGRIRVMRIIARLNVGGPAIHVALLSAGLDPARFETQLVAGALSPGEGDMSYVAHSLGVEPVILPTLRREIAPAADLRSLLDLLRLMRNYRPHVVHTHTAKAGLLGRLAALMTGVPVVVHTFHGHVFYGYFGRIKTALFLWLERAAARVSDAILTLNEGLRREIMGFLRVAPERIRVIPLGFDLRPFRDLSPLRGALRAELALSTDTPLVGIIGRLAPVKNHALFLAAARLLVERIPSARFLVVGDGEERLPLEALARDMGLADQVIFTGWRRDLPAVYAGLNLVVISSHNEGTPVSLIEAMASGVPVVSTAVGGVPELLRDGELGALVAPDDVHGLADAMQRSLTTCDEARIHAARTWVFEQFDGTRLVSDIEALYLELLQAKGVLPDQGPGPVQ